MDFLQRTPFFRLLVPLVCGIVAFRYLELFILMRLICLISAVIFMLVSFFLQQSRYAYKLRWLFGVGIVLFLFLLGYLISERKQQHATFLHVDEQAIFVARLLESPAEKTNSMACKVGVEGIYDSVQFVKFSSHALAYVAKDSAALSLKKGDVLLMRTTFQRPSKALNPEGFDYAAYLANKGITATAFVRGGDWQVLTHQHAFSIASLAEKCRNNLLRLYESLDLPKDQFAVLAALTLGYKDALDPELREDFSHSGAMHILAVSGLHVGVIYMILQALFSLVFKKSKWKFASAVFTICALWMYAFITGLPPSVVRATTMFSLVAIGTVLERKSQIYNTISVSAFVILLYDPNLLFDVGFQLSYCAVIGIVYFQPKIASLWYVKHKLLKWWWDLTSVSMAAQIATLPLALYYFHQFPNYFLLTNYIAIPLATLIIYFAVAFLVLSPIFWLEVVPVFILKKLLYLLNFSVGFIRDLPHAISVCYLSFFQVSLLFGVIFFFSFHLEIKRYWSIASTLITLLVFVLSHVYVHVQTLQLNQLVVYADRKHTHVNFITTYNHELYTTDSLVAVKAATNYWKSKKLNYPEFKVQESTTFRIINGKKILILKDDLLHRKMTDKPFNTDFLIIGNGLRPRASELLNCVRPKICIADQTISSWYIDKLKASCKEKGIAFYSVSEQGAFIYDFNQQNP
ncbi:MAG: ComEC/Rec2 family competence protein [Paludibacter sp.]|nr:ComEC/Rec2 family competence protein [Paludibacter sp.]